MMLSKEIFKEVIEDMRDKFDFQTKLNDFFRENKVDGCIYYPDCSDSLLMVLEHVFSDEETQMISYFCWELDFGRNWKPGDVEDTDGKEIKMETIDDLYAFLTE